MQVQVAQDLITIAVITVIVMLQVLTLLVVLHTRSALRRSEKSTEPNTTILPDTPHQPRLSTYRSDSGSAPPNPTHSTTTVCELLKLHPSGWKHEGWVRRDRPAYRIALSTPGYAVINPDGVRQEGQGA